MTTTTAPETQQVTHDVFDVVRREGRRSRWDKIGAGYTNSDGRQSIELDAGDGRAPRRFVLLRIDRLMRPIPAGADATRYPTHELFEAGGLVGVAFLNRDGSLTLVIDEGRREGPRVRLQVRARRAR